MPSIFSWLRSRWTAVVRPANAFDPAYAIAFIRDQLALRYPEVLAAGAGTADTAGPGPRVMITDLRLVDVVRETLPNAWVSLYGSDAWCEAHTTAWTNRLRLVKPPPRFDADGVIPTRTLLVPHDELLDAALAVVASAQTVIDRHLALNETDWPTAWQAASCAARYRFLSQIPGLSRSPSLIRVADAFAWGLEIDQRQSASVRAMTALDVAVLDKRENEWREGAAGAARMADVSKWQDSSFRPVSSNDAEGLTWLWANLERRLCEQIVGYDLIVFAAAGAFGTVTEADGAPPNLCQTFATPLSLELMKSLRLRTAKHGVRILYGANDVTVVQDNNEQTRGREFATPNGTIAADFEYKTISAPLNARGDLQ